jgi:hypothetical protein
VRWAGDLLDELFQERLDHVRGLRGPETDVGSLDEDVRDEGEGERMAVGEVQDGAVLIRRNIPPVEVRLALLPAQVLEPKRAYEPLPAGIHAPAWLRWVAAREDDE